MDHRIVVSLIAFIAVFGFSIRGVLAENNFLEKQFMTRMLTLVEDAPIEIYNLGGQELALQKIHVGTPYHPGEVAYFFKIFDPKSGDILEIGMQLEKWVLDGKGGFAFEFWRIFLLCG